MRTLAIVAAVAACTPANAAPRAASGERVLARYCVRCHGPKRAESDFGFANDTARLVAAGMIVPGDPDASVIVRRIELGEMPPSGKRPSKAELAELRRWIAGMDAPGVFRDDASIERILAADAAGLDAVTRDSSRYFTLVHLANAGVPDSQLDAYRSALAILLASLTWAPAPEVMVPVDAERLVYRIDLRELGWSTATWDLIRASYPYGIARPRDVPDAIRADWFVATASRGALYHAVLGLPDREDALVRLLGIDPATAPDARAGFNDSGVSVNNRVIERRASRFGAYWRSYDFASSVGTANVFRHPLDFVPAGGELIFNLPDGMQAYMLVDGTGRRIDKAPTTIVSDPRRRDRAVETALSCFGCHGAGIVAHADQVRDSSTDARVRAAYTEADALADVYADDAARFARALVRVGATPEADPDREPVTALAARYERDLDLRLAAAELGLRPDELAARIARSRTARRDLAGLTVTGGTIKRDTWAAAFPRIAVALGVGVPLTPAVGGPTPAVNGPTPAIWIDRQRRTWFAVAEAVTRNDAEHACRVRGGTLPTAAELVVAAGQGLAGGLGAAGQGLAGGLGDTQQGLTGGLGAAQAWTRDRKLDALNQRYALVVDIVTATSVRASPGERHAAICIQRSPEDSP